MHQGDLIKALRAYEIAFPKQKLVALVDFNNDIITDSLKVVKVFGSKLGAVRVDTASNLVDKYFNDRTKKEAGVNPTLIKALRKALDNAGAKDVQIIISSGLTPSKIIEFEKAETPIDIYGVGAYLLKVHIFYTADAVKLNGKEIAKFGRSYKKF
jgi:nicotinate phosphoribosyltransferase